MIQFLQNTIADSITNTIILAFLTPHDIANLFVNKGQKSLKQELVKRYKKLALYKTINNLPFDAFFQHQDPGKVCLVLLQFAQKLIFDPTHEIFILPIVNGEEMINYMLYDQNTLKPCLSFQTFRGKLQEQSFGYDFNGMKRSAINFMHNVVSGKTAYFDVKGDEIYTANYSHGDKHGNFIHTDDFGVTTWTFYEKNKLTKKKITNKEGIVTYKYEMSNKGVEIETKFESKSREKLHHQEKYPEYSSTIQMFEKFFQHGKMNKLHIIEYSFHSPNHFYIEFDEKEQETLITCNNNDTKLHFYGPKECKQDTYSKSCVRYLFYRLGNGTPRMSPSPTIAPFYQIRNRKLHKITRGKEVLEEFDHSGNLLTKPRIPWFSP